MQDVLSVVLPTAMGLVLTVLVAAGAFYDSKLIPLIVTTHLR